jgi:hypothetical protein
VGTQISTHILQYIKMPKFNEKNKNHLELSYLSEQCHEAALKNETDKIAELERRIDQAAASLWGIDDKELEAMQQTLLGMEGNNLPG